MNIDSYDVLIIGAGPSGAVSAAMLANKGYQVLVVEKQHFPRFSIGESLLPQCMAFLSEAGLEDNVHQGAKEHHFQFKNGAAFHRAGVDTYFDFTQKFSDGPGTTYQVKRADFDKLLADGAEEKGAKILYGASVLNVETDAQGAVLEIEDEQGVKSRVSGKFLLDASGFARVLPRLFDLEQPSSFPTRRSLFTHIKDNIDCSCFDRDKILITVHPEQQDIWFWLIPFSDGTASIGVVGKPEQFDDSLSEYDNLTRFISETPNLKQLLENAEWPNPVNKLEGYSADVTSLTGQNYALLGNAGEFLDPVFSSGVTIALCSAALIVPLVDEQLKGGDVDFYQQFEQPLRRGVDCFKTFVTSWYEGGFQDVIFHQDQDEKIRQMISSILAGYAWDQKNPYVAQSERRLNVLVDLCQ